MRGEHSTGRDRALWGRRERFHGEGVVAEKVRPAIARSWVRSRESGVRPDGDPTTRAAPFDPDRRLLRVAQPILDRLADEVSGADMTVILTDPGGLVLDRRAGTASLLRGLDRVFLSPGHIYSEDTVGTNGIGTAAEDRDVAWVVGSEHFAEWLRWLSCAGAPIRNPITGRIEGVLDLTCRVRDTSPLMVPFVKEGVREIERRLYEAASHSDRDLLDRFEAVARRSRGPVVAMNAQTVITNAAAARLLEPTDHALLWDQVADAIEEGAGVASRIRLSSGGLALIRFVAFERGDPQRGAVVRIDVEGPAAPPIPTTRRPPARIALPGRSLAWQQACQAAVEQARTGLPLLLTGEPGVGKLALARGLHDQRGDAGPFTVLDASVVPIDGASSWLGLVRARLADARGTLVLRHLEALDAETGRALGEVLEAALGSPSPWVRATLTLGPAADAPPAPATGTPLTDRFPAVVRVPPLRERPEDVADLLPALVRRHVSGPAPRCSPDLVHALVRTDWPDNVRQVETLVKRMLARRPFGELTLRDLPPEYRSAPPRRLSRMELAERAAILQALAQTGGNKLQAAAILGIARATLYRKLKELSIS